MNDGLANPLHHALFAGVAPQELVPLRNAARAVTFLPGEVLFREGDVADGLYLITGGSVRVTATADTGETFIAVVAEQEVVGEMGVLDGEPRSGTASAFTVVTGYFVPAEAFLDLLERSGAVCLRLLVVLTRRLRRANGRLGELPATGVLTAEPHADGG